MSPVLKNILAVIAGIVIGSMVNMGILMLGSSIIPMPEGVEMTSQSLKENIHLFEFKHYISPFLAHALGTLVGALISALIAASFKMRFALAIGIFFLIGGIANLIMIAGPAWFAAVDVILAYIPMAWIGGNWGVRFSK